MHPFKYSSLIISLTNQFDISHLFQNRTITVAPSFGDPNPQQEKSQRRPAIVIQVGVVEGCYTNVMVVIGLTNLLRWTLSKKPQSSRIYIFHKNQCKQCLENKSWNAYVEIILSLGLHRKQEAQELKILLPFYLMDFFFLVI